MLIFTETKICNLPHPPPSPATKRDDERASLASPSAARVQPLLLYDALFRFVNRYMTRLLTLAQDGGQRASRS